MNVFDLREKLIADYGSFVNGFINIKDNNIKEMVERELREGHLWPDPLIQLSPFFEPGESIDALIKSGILHPMCSQIFRIRREQATVGDVIQLHRHQTEAIKRAVSGKNYVLTTGTGSGKSLAYIIPIVNHVLQAGSGKGIKAIIIYPMNALANSQEGELRKFIDNVLVSGKKTVTFRRYTGQESDQEKNEICANPPDIILTNYVMLELILTRPAETPLVNACKGLKFLVLDELHTYRGRQGADVAMLIRRAREATAAKDVICVGTSATLASSGDLHQQQQEISRVASLLFGAQVESEDVIGETLQRITTEYDFSQADQISNLKKDINLITDIEKISFEQVKASPLASWVESTFGLSTDQDSNRLIRSTPKSINDKNGGADALSQLTGIDSNSCALAIQKMLMLGFNTENPHNHFPVFAFRIHQFISRGDTVYASLNEKEIRHQTLQRQLFVPGSNKGRILLPLVFCRHCGQEYYTVTKVFDEESQLYKFLPRDLTEHIMDQDQQPGFLYYSEDNPWPDDSTANADRIPEEWKDQDGKILRNRKDYLPKPIKVSPDGRSDNAGLAMQFLEAPFRLCLNCGVSYSSNQRSDYAKLSALGTEGRSTATTILSLSAVRHIKNMDLPKEAQKLLNFTDNRQDASLQAGHFNDFVQIGLLRGALYHALEGAGADGVRHSELTQLVFNSLNLPLTEYASNPEGNKGLALIETERSLRNVLGYHIYRDLRRGWRVTAPNLEQTGLLDIDYLSLGELAADHDIWDESHNALKTASPKTRNYILKVLLDWMRRGLAIKVLYLDPQELDKIVLQSQQRLISPWGFDEDEQSRQLTHAAILYPRSRRQNRDYSGNVFLSTRSGFGQFLRRANTFPAYSDNIDTQDTQTLIDNLLGGLVRYGIIERVSDTNDPGYQLVADAMLWRAGAGSNSVHDPIRQTSVSREGQPVHEFFRDFYRFVASSTLGLRSKEHTAQVSYDERELREQEFRNGSLPILYCSPTMELGIDISQLNVVGMRNVPPTPANYAQRSGRAGRSGQPALIFTYCSTGSPHDQYFFKRPANMVCGAVATPQIDIANEDMLRSHVHAIWLTEAKLSLGTNLTEIIDANGTKPSLELLPSVLDTFTNSSIRKKALVHAARVIDTIEYLISPSVWYSSDWLESTINQLSMQFEQACNRWRGLLRAALRQQDVQNRIILDVTRPGDREQAKRLRAEAEAQLKLLTTSKGALQSDFYSYRYFASEGFLPGYNFPRLPLSAFIPGKRVHGGRDEYLTRPRFLAITEFGPRSFVYHEGSRYIIHQVIIPAEDDRNEISTSEAKLCPKCGYLHQENLDNVCEHCGDQLDAPIRNLLRLQNVVAKRRDQINCDEEERLKLGFDIRTTLRFASRSGNLSCIQARIMNGDECLGRLTYGDAAMIWRINMGYKFRKPGFVLDMERGYWGKYDEDDSTDADSPIGKNYTRVQPYVSDTKNCLLFEPEFDINDTIITSLQSALKNAIQRVFELEDNELAVEPLPSKDVRKAILFYEATEGGAGVLKQVMDNSGFNRIIKKAIEICHYDPSTFADQKRAASAKEDCEAACYDCLMSYTNQTDHELLDRKAIIDILNMLLGSRVSLSSSSLPREQHYQQLLNLAGSDLEKKWLAQIYDNGYVLPSAAQQLIEECNTRPDFTYTDKHAVIYIDGPIHNEANIRKEDLEINARLDDKGYYVIRFRYDEEWPPIIDKHANVFGTQD